MSGEETEIAVEGFFTAIRHEPATQIFRRQVEMDDAGYVVQKEYTMMSVPGVFAAGDVSVIRYRQAITAAGDGSWGSYSCAER
jgi:thioredoxin reductase (NADPH)